jgi:hypothetical protein
MQTSVDVRRCTRCKTMRPRARELPFAPQSKLAQPILQGLSPPGAHAARQPISPTAAAGVGVSVGLFPVPDSDALARPDFVRRDAGRYGTR